MVLNAPMKRVSCDLLCAVGLTSLVGLTCVLGCGGAKPSAETATAAQEPASSSQPEVAPSSVEATEESGPGADGPGADGKWSIPSTCYKEGDICTPNPRWVKQLCQDVYPAVALYLFQAKSPFTHAYLSRKTKAVNASGGATSGSEWLAFDEEVVLLYHRAANTGGIQVSGESGGFDAMRLDGSCVTLDAAEVRMETPPTPKYTEVPWRYLGDDVEKSLLDVPAIKDAYIARRKECKGAFSGDVSAKCVKLDAALNVTIVASLKQGATDLPQPGQRP